MKETAADAMTAFAAGAGPPEKIIPTRRGEDGVVNVRAPEGLDFRLETRIQSPVSEVAS
jgi:hypothetical protein